MLQQTWVDITYVQVVLWDNNATLERTVSARSVRAITHLIASTLLLHIMYILYQHRIVRSALCTDIELSDNITATRPSLPLNVLFRVELQHCSHVRFLRLTGFFSVTWKQSISFGWCYKDDCDSKVQEFLLLRLLRHFPVPFLFWIVLNFSTISKKEIMIFITIKFKCSVKVTLVRKNIHNTQVQRRIRGFAIMTLAMKLAFRLM